MKSISQLDFNGPKAMDVMNTIDQFTAAINHNIYVQNTKKTKERTPGWHMSASGSCLRKTILNDTFFPGNIEHGIAFKGSFENKEEFERLHTIGEIDPNSNGIFCVGDMFHKRISYFGELSNILHYSEFTQQIMIEFPHFAEGGMNEDSNPIAGTLDGLIINELIEKMYIVDFKSCGEAQFMFHKNRLVSPVDESFGPFKVVDVDQMNAFQITGYYYGLKKLLAENTHKNIDLFKTHTLGTICLVCYINKNNFELMWGLVEPALYKERLEAYWTAVKKAHMELCETGQLPPAHPCESWECKWGKEPHKQCKYYSQCVKEGIK